MEIELIPEDLIATLEGEFVVGISSDCLVSLCVVYFFVF